jgi:hypothetical protein
MSEAQPVQWIHMEEYASIAASRPSALVVPKAPSIEISRSLPHEHFPRQMLFEFSNMDRGEDMYLLSGLRLLDADPNHFEEGPIQVQAHDGVTHALIRKTHGFELGKKIGNSLTDNSFEPDGFRFHDALHIALAAHTGWSPVLRSLLRLKRRSLPQVDEIEDGARAIGFEESIFIWTGGGRQHSDSEAFERMIDFTAEGLERGVRPLTLERLYIPRERWRAGLIAGRLLFEKLTEEIGAIDPRDKSRARSAFVAVDLDRQEVRMSCESPEEAWRGELMAT